MTSSPEAAYLVHWLKENGYADPQDGTMPRFSTAARLVGRSVPLWEDASKLAERLMERFEVIPKCTLESVTPTGYGGDDHSLPPDTSELIVDCAVHGEIGSVPAGPTEGELVDQLFAGHLENPDKAFWDELVQMVFREVRELFSPEMRNDICEPLAYQNVIGAISDGMTAFFAKHGAEQG